MREVRQNILEVTAPAVICHQVNCRGVMGAGLAKKIAMKWPVVLDDYRQFILSQHSEASHLLGKVRCVPVDEGIVVANIFGQVDYGVISS